MTETFLTKKSTSKKLENVISYYYFHQMPQPGSSRRIVFYPNTINAITVYKNAELHFENPDVSRTMPSQKITTYYSGLRKRAGISMMDGPLEKIGIAFLPLGINKILDVPLSDCISKKTDWKFDVLNDSLLPVLETVLRPMIWIAAWKYSMLILNRVLALRSIRCLKKQSGSLKKTKEIKPFQTSQKQLEHRRKH